MVPKANNATFTTSNEEALMTNVNNLQAEIDFVEELIRRFFHTKSYFYFNLQNALKFEYQNSAKDVQKLELMSNLISYLVTSADPVKDLQEISHIKGFKDIYSQFVNELSATNFSDFDRNATKKFISQLAVAAFNNWQAILSDSQIRILLKSYLELKIKLKMLVADTSNSDTFISQSLLKLEDDSPTADQSSALSPIQVWEAKFDEPREEKAFQTFLVRELSRVLSPIKANYFETSSEKISAELVETFYERFFKTRELALFHDYQEVVQISERVLTILDYIRAHKNDLDEDSFFLLVEAKRHIIKNVKNDQKGFDVRKICQKLDSYTFELKKRHHDDSNGKASVKP
ncbi:MAG: hypothetical protein SCK70_03340, partial [bacterium]|nr:hypothetical protein [bacterium]